MEQFNAMRALDCRIGLNLSVEYVSGLLDVTVAHLEAIEQGKLYPKFEIINYMLEIYGCSKSYLLSESTDHRALVLARNGTNIAESDQKQVLEFLAFQKQISQKVFNVN